MVVTDATLDDAPHSDDARGEHAPAEAPGPAEPDADAVLMFTSGTTAAAEGRTGDAPQHRRQHRVDRRSTSVCGADRVLVILPFFYCYGASLLHTHLRVGGSVALCNTFVFPETALDLLEREQCTGFAGVPSSFQLLLRAGGFGSRAAAVAAA